MGSKPEKLAAACPSHEDEEEDAQAMAAIKIINAVAFPMVLKSALELGLIETLCGDGKGDQEFLSPSQIVDRLPRRPKNPQLAAEVLDRVLRLLTSYSILSCRGQAQIDGDRAERFYAAKPICKYFAKKNQDSISFGPMHSLLHNKRYLEGWDRLSDAVLGGIPFEEAHGMPLYEITARDESFNKLFNEAMVDSTTFVMSKLLKVCKGFEGLRVLVDVGGGIGITSSIITKMYPNTKAVCFDLPHVIASAPPYPGVEFVEGDMFMSVPKGDAIFMKSILHSWSDEDCTKILKNCWDALPENGKVIIMDLVLDAVPGNDLHSRIMADIDLTMLCLFRGGKERTLKDFEDLAAKSGFHKCQLACSVYHFGLVEFYKAS